jgi:hypothetical protein
MHYARNCKHVYIDWSGTTAGYGVAWSDDEPTPYLMPSGVRIESFPPQLHLEPVIVPEHPWEQLNINAYATLFEDDGRFRLYYEAYDIYESHDGGDYSARVCYAESTDGVNWTKPSLGVCQFNGSKDNNIVMQAGMGLGKGPHGAMVFRDPQGGDSDRYKMVYCASDAHKKPFVAGAVSPDGIAWTGLDKPVIPEQFADTQTVIAWDSDRQVYVGYFRDWPAGDLYPERRIVLHATTTDFYNWPERKTVFAADSQDDPGTDVYTNSYTAWPGAQNAHIMFPCFYPRTRDTMETHFAVSRDGVNWERPNREPLWGGYGAPGSFCRAGVVASQGIISPKPGEWEFLAGCRVKTHNETHYGDGLSGPSGLWRVTMREDGLMALTAEARGECWSNPLTFEGDTLRVNAWTHFGGSVRIGLCAEDGTPIPGFALNDCDPLTGDQIWPSVTWRGNAAISSLEGKTIRLHIDLIRGRLHAWRIGD